VRLKKQLRLQRVVEASWDSVALHQIWLLLVRILCSNTMLLVFYIRCDRMTEWHCKLLHCTIENLLLIFANSVKMVQQYSAAGVVKSPAATVLLVRLAAKLAEDDPGLRKPMMQLLDGWLRHKSEMVNFEAAKAICDMRDVTDAEIANAVHVLQLFLTSPRAVTKFAAIRILSTFASFKPEAVRPANQDIESLIGNSNRGSPQSYLSAIHAPRSWPNNQHIITEIDNRFDRYPRHNDLAAHWIRIQC
jgi:hypothetical protein